MFQYSALNQLLAGERNSDVDSVIILCSFEHLRESASDADGRVVVPANQGRGWPGLGAGGVQGAGRGAAPWRLGPGPAPDPAQESARRPVPAPDPGRPVPAQPGPPGPLGSASSPPRFLSASAGPASRRRWRPSRCQLAAAPDPPRTEATLPAPLPPPPPHDPVHLLAFHIRPSLARLFHLLMQGRV